MDALTNSQFTSLRAALLDENSEPLVEFLYKYSLGHPIDMFDPDAVAFVASLGLMDERQHFTPLGSLVADAIREYQFWVERDRKVHMQDETPRFAPQAFEGKTVLELGSGFGCNLLTFIRTVKGRFVGVEPVRVHLQLAPVIAEREGLPTPEVVQGSAESIPFCDEQFDVVLCYSSHQYMVIRQALREIHRVLRPGGRLQIVGGTLGKYVGCSVKGIMEHASLFGIKDLAMTVGNTLAYQTIGRRLIVPSGPAATTAPIYPVRSFMRRCLKQAGFDPLADTWEQAGVETLFYADRLA